MVSIIPCDFNCFSQLRIKKKLDLFTLFEGISSVLASFRVNKIRKSLSKYLIYCTIIAFSAKLL
jgi:hypothetical protein